MRARRRFGQHFLEPAWVRKVVDAIAPAPDDHFLEIGPGRGALTEPLSTRAAAVAAVEVDRDFAAALTRRRLPNLAVVGADVLEVDLAGVARDTLGATPGMQTRVVGNLPYNISSPILFRLLAAADQSGVFRDASLMLQKEVADRLVARPGTREYGVLTVLTALSAEVTPLLSLPPGAFRPVPRIRSTLVKLAFRPSPVPIRDRTVMVELVRSVFTQRRKTLSNALGRFANAHGRDPGMLLDAAGIDGRRRPETLQLVEFARLAEACHSG